MDDSPTQRAFVERALGPAPRYEHFVDGESLLARISDRGALPNLILLDWVMPGIGGDDVCRCLRDDVRTRSVPIVILTASRLDTSDVVAALQAGASDYLSKPFAPEELRARVASILRAEESRRIAEVERARLATVNRLGNALFASASNVNEIVQALIDGLVPTFCDGCSVLFEREGSAPLTHSSPSWLTMRRSLGRDEIGGAMSSLARAVPLRAAGVKASVTMLRDARLGCYDEDEISSISACLEYAGVAFEVAISGENERTTTRFHEEMLGIVGHDLRTPLGAIAIGAEVLRCRMHDPFDEAVLTRVERSVRRMTGIVEHLLDVTRSRIGHGISVLRTPMSLNGVIGGVLDELRGAHALTKFELSGDNVRGSWDQGRLEQVFSNLLSNAAKYGCPEGVVRIAIVHAGHSARITIHNELRDAPLPRKTLDTLFDPFVRGDSLRGHEGLGLGLYIVREIVRAHEGTITVDSSESGTTFCITLPFDEMARDSR